MLSLDILLILNTVGLGAIYIQTGFNLVEDWNQPSFLVVLQGSIEDVFASVKEKYEECKTYEHSLCQTSYDSHETC